MSTQLCVLLLVDCKCKLALQTSLLSIPCFLFAISAALFNCSWFQDTAAITARYRALKLWRGCPAGFAICEARRWRYLRRAPGLATGSLCVWYLWRREELLTSEFLSYLRVCSLVVWTLGYDTYIWKCRLMKNETQLAKKTINPAPSIIPAVSF